MDTDTIKTIVENIPLDYDITDSDDVTQLILDILNTFDKTEFEYALLQIGILKENEGKDVE